MSSSRSKLRAGWDNGGETEVGFGYVKVDGRTYPLRGWRGVVVALACVPAWIVMVVLIVVGFTLSILGGIVALFGSLLTVLPAELAPVLCKDENGPGEGRNQ
jgi:hypothetical protein